MRNVLLAIDGSNFAFEAASFLSHLPHREKLRLTVVTAIEVPYGNLHYPTTQWVAESIAAEKIRAAASFERVKKMFQGAHVELQHVVREGARGATIVALANEIAADLVVIGARGHSTVQRILLGSVSDYVATHSPCSVLVIRPQQQQVTGRPLRIAIGYDDSAPSNAAAEEISAIQWGAETDIRVVSVVSFLAGVFPGTALDTAQAKHSVTAKLDQAVERLQTKTPRASAVVLENEHIGDGLTQFTSEHQTDIVVVGETPHSVLARLVLGSVSRYVLRHAQCSVWIARQSRSPSQSQQSSASLTRQSQTSVSRGNRT